MRWKAKPRPKVGDVRTRRGFLWLPMRIENGVRWLEFATWQEELTGGEWIARVWID